MWHYVTLAILAGNSSVLFRGAENIGTVRNESDAKAICDAMNQFPKLEKAAREALSELEDDGRTAASSDGVEMLREALLIQ